jgi:YgiT-type zinc finger domain-containing protein
MSDYPLNPCANCGGKVRYKTISRKFSREGTTVTVKGVRAIVCGKCGEVFFEPEAAQALLDTANALFVLAQKNRQRKGQLAGVAS